MRRKRWEHISGAVGIFHCGRSLLWADMAKKGREKTFIKHLLCARLSAKRFLHMHHLI